jgi:hypothetical protein
VRPSQAATRHGLPRGFPLASHGLDNGVHLLLTLAATIGAMPRGATFRLIYPPSPNSMQSECMILIKTCCEYRSTRSDGAHLVMCALAAITGDRAAHKNVLVEAEPYWAPDCLCRASNHAVPSIPCLRAVVCQKRGPMPMTCLLPLLTCLSRWNRTDAIELASMECRTCHPWPSSFQLWQVIRN